LGNEVKIDGYHHNLIFKEEVYRVVGACMEVLNTLEPGFLEPVYQQALQHELGLQQIPFTAQTPIKISYKDLALEKYYVADFVIFDRIILEIKALSALDANHLAQVLNYLKATGYPLGLLVNFGAKCLEWKRVAN